ncbi:unnamed protein product [Eruca vesicaria subsp. sativa]|uniref:Uncharacterized protein n=1 Tax=Eruca vesicaria subsp. sativa TaxID=29727 RepID=A0ABC8LH30_ERUVS|nr:unnamed protein product [Eruca vesicaria subsp. sativa]
MDFMDSETQAPDDSPFWETDHDMPPPLAAECKSFKWKVEVIEFFIETRTKPNGSFVCEEAKERAEALTVLLSQNPHNTNNVTASLDDEYAQVFGPERPGRVRCVGRGPTPSKLVCRSTATRPDIENSEMVVELKTQVKELSDQVKGMTTFIQQIIGTSTGEQARAWAASFAVAFANIPDPTFANIPNPPNPDQCI